MTPKRKAYGYDELVAKFDITRHQAPKFDAQGRELPQYVRPG